MACHVDVDKVAFTGSTEVGQVLRQATAGTGKRLSLELGGKSPVVVFDTADVDSAVEGIVDAIWFNQGQVCSAGSRLLVQETVCCSYYTVTILSAVSVDSREDGTEVKGPHVPFTAG